MSKFVHMELNTSDVKAAKKFYKSLFSWKVTDMKMGDGSVYTMVEGAEGGIGGIASNPMPGAPSSWLGYIGVASVNKAVKKASKLGAKIVVDRMEVPGMGAFAIMIDPTGAQVAVWEAAAPPKKAGKKAAKKAGKKASKKAAKKAGKKAAKKTAAAAAAPKKAKKGGKKKGK